MKNTVFRLVKWLCSLKPIKQETILIIETSFPSGSNTTPITNTLKETYSVDVYRSEEIFFERKTVTDYLKYISILFQISSYQLIISSHGFNKLNSKQTVIELWHGIPLKSMMYMEQDPQIYDAHGFNADYLITSSKLESALLAACTHIPFANHRVLGSPRIDYLFQQRENDLTNQFHDYDKVLLYVPTYRTGYQNRVEGEDALDLIMSVQFLQYLEDHSYLLVVKLHSLEQEKILTNNNRYLMFLTNEKLIECGLDFYQILPDTDLLLTDYSSVYFDYLLLNHPIIFIDRDLEHYRNTRGLLLEPYEYWTPGDKVKTTEEILQSIERSFKHDDYRDKRQELRDTFFHYQDGQSTQRIVDLIADIMEP